MVPTPTSRTASFVANGLNGTLTLLRPCSPHPAHLCQLEQHLATRTMCVRKDTSGNTYDVCTEGHTWQPENPHKIKCGNTSRYNSSILLYHVALRREDSVLGPVVAAACARSQRLTRLACVAVIMHNMWFKLLYSELKTCFGWGPCHQTTDARVFARSKAQLKSRLWRYFEKRG